MAIQSDAMTVKMRHEEDLVCSRLIYGTWRIVDNVAQYPPTPENILARIEKCLELGITSCTRTVPLYSYIC